MLGNSVVRGREAGDIIKALCQAGFRDEAWSLVRSDQGLVRNHQRISCFLNARLSTDQVLREIRRVACQPGNRCRRVGLASATAPHDPAKLLDPKTMPECNVRTRDSQWWHMRLSAGPVAVC